MKKSVPYNGAGEEQLLIIRDIAVLCFGKTTVKGGDLL